jgi:hypothetical protein
MSIDEIRQQKGLALLECQEAETRVKQLRGELKHLSGTLDRLARLLDPGEDPSPSRVPNLNQLQGGAFQRALDYEATVRLVIDVNEATKALAEAQGKKLEFGLR